MPAVRDSGRLRLFASPPFSFSLSSPFPRGPWELSRAARPFPRLSMIPSKSVTSHRRPFYPYTTGDTEGRRFKPPLRNQDYKPLCTNKLSLRICRSSRFGRFQDLIKWSSNYFFLFTDTLANTSHWKVGSRPLPPRTRVPTSQATRPHARPRRRTEKRTFNG